MSVPYGEYVSGELDVVCKKCDYKWVYKSCTDKRYIQVIEGYEGICEYMGLNCPSCKEYTQHHIIGFRGFVYEDKEDFILLGQRPDLLDLGLDEEKKKYINLEE